MDVVLAIVAVVLAVLGPVGSILPVLPGPPLSYVGLVVLAFASYHPFSWTFMIVWGAITVAVTLADYFLPSYMTARFGGSKYATTGSMIGVVAGFFVFPPWGLIFCPFVGALIGELLWDGRNTGRAFKVAAGAFLAFVLGTGAKLTVTAIMLYYVIKALIVN